MNRIFAAACLAAMAFSAACASRWPAQHIEIVPGSVTGDSALEGSYRWVSLEGKAPPVEYPANSGIRLVYGTLDLRNAMAARSGSGGQYSIRFTEQPVGDTVRTTGSDGQFSLRGDTLRLTPTGQGNALTFRYAWRPTGDLALTDPANRVWLYSRR